MTPDTPWLQVLGGKSFDLTNPTPDQVDFHTIALVLARTPRFSGHTDRGILSVAQHCLEGAHAMQRDGCSRLACAAFLIHDAHEAYMGDIATPVVDALAHIADWSGDDLRASVKELKSRLDRAIYTAAGLPYPLSADVAAIVHEYDLRMCRTERDARLAPPSKAWADAIERADPVEGCDLYPWSEGTVRALYAQALRDFGIDNHDSRG